MRKWLSGWLRGLPEWMGAWFGGSAVTAFGLGRADLGWTWAGLSLVMLACDLTLSWRRRSP